MTFTSFAAWGAALADWITILGILVAGGSLLVSFRDWRHRQNLESARLAWELANGIHEEENAVNALELLDGETRRVISSRHGSFDLSTLGEIETALRDTNPTDDVDAKGAAIRAAFDSLLYAIDRVRSVYRTKPPIVSENEISPATFYYCDLIVRRHEYVIRYAENGPYRRTVPFILDLASRYSTLSCEKGL
jgi:hypothetical protein